MHAPAGEPVHDPIAAAPATNVPSSRRLAALAVFLVAAGVLTVAYGLTPNLHDGVGTHKSLGLPACGLYEVTGVPCATCGMTTSFSLAAHGQLGAAFINQPAGAILAVFTAMAAVLSGYALVTGMSLAPIGLMLWRPRVVIVGLAIVLAAWVYKIVVVAGWFGANT